MQEHDQLGSLDGSPKGIKCVVVEAFAYAPSAHDDPFEVMQRRQLRYCLQEGRDGDAGNEREESEAVKSLHGRTRDCRG
jgi:hypothetical protein